MELCRYISFNRFCEMLFFKELSLVSPELWNDKYENYILQVLKAEDGAERLKNDIIIAKEFSEEHATWLVNFIKMVCSSVRCLCFSRSYDSEVMWNAYNNNNQTIMLVTDDHRVESINPDFEIRIVKYDLEQIGYKSFLCTLPSHIDDSYLRNTYELFIHKREFFSYENEVRVINLEDTKAPKVKSYPVPSLSDFISGVMVHPLADERYTLLIRKMCREFGLVFLGRSRIYEMKTII